ncbi:universal stress protein [Saccharopolyspora hordei]|uniref:Nucleotide-binding universal stress UspA family protein n=1 Tax=Saccharopolyspora hordei TaxID=1838 RepID=A0A853AIF1_9PSEU|nr:universal stress protein [Saccharopolyspora hordei]NYI84424.1 nucleotide-binding universal stress UspA family protein [Saccharopolyspora hordei]
MAEGVRAPVVAGYDLSAPSRRAVWWAAREASGRRLPLWLVHVLAWPYERYVPLAAPGGGDVLRPLQDVVRRELGSVAASCREIDPELEVRDELRFGDPAEVLEDLAGKAALLVLGGPRVEEELGPLGATSAELLTRRTETPVVVVRGEHDEPDGRPVVVGVDGSEHSRQAIGFACDFASRHHCPLVAVHAWSDLPLDAFTWVEHWDVPWQQVREEGMEVLASCLAGWGEHYPDVEVRRAVTPEKPADALLREAEGAALLVVGSHGRGFIRRSLLGSVSHAVVHRAPCPVAVLHVG